MCLAQHNDQIKSKTQIINNITFDIAIENCLAPLHNKFPTLRFFIDFDHDIDFEIDFDTLSQLLRMKNNLLIQLGNQEVAIVEARFKRDLAKSQSQDIVSNIRKKIKEDVDIRVKLQEDIEKQKG